MHVMKCQLIGGNVVVAIPRALARELEWTRHTFVTVARGDDNTVTLTSLEAQLGKRKRSNPDTTSSDPRTITPTARDNRRGEAR